MPRPNRDRVRVTLFLPRCDVEDLQQMAHDNSIPIGDVYRAVFAAGLTGRKLDVRATQ